MRRRLEVFIPIVMLSILTQIFAPVAAFRLVADAVSDPLSMGSICSETMSSPADPRTAPMQQSHGGCCVFCAAGHSVVAIAVDPPPFIFVILQRQYQRVSWLEAANLILTVRVGSNAQARAPPQLT
jgi:hypothetical protein